MRSRLPWDWSEPVVRGYTVTLVSSRGATRIVTISKNSS